MTLFFLVLLCIAFASTLVAGQKDFDCNQFNNNCLSCIQYSKRLAFQCSYCPVDGTRKIIPWRKLSYDGILPAVGAFLNLFFGIWIFIAFDEVDLRLCQFVAANIFKNYWLGVCHTVGSLFNKCKNEECVSLSSASSCTMRTADDCKKFVYGEK